MKKILVLGQTGYIGSQFINELKLRNLSYEGISRVNMNYTSYSCLLNFIKRYQKSKILYGYWSNSRGRT